MTAEIIKTARIEKDLTQTELAELLRVSYAAVASWEKGHRTPHPKRKHEIERKLGLETGALGSRSTRRGPQRPKQTTPAAKSDEGQRKDHTSTPTAKKTRSGFDD